MRVPLPGAALLLSLGCSTPNLADTPIVGGDDAVRDAIRAELSAFDAATGGGRTRVSQVRVHEMGERFGRFNSVSHGISLDSDLDEVRVVEVLRHELCHALDAAEGLHADTELYDRLAEGAFSSSFVRTGSSCRSEACQRREVFAAWCARGPWVSHALARRCPDDPPDGQRVLQHMSERLWLGDAEPLPTTEAPAWASVALGPAEEIRTWSTTSPTTFGLVVQEGEDAHLEFIDAHTGENVSGEGLAALQSPEGAPAGLPFELQSFEIVDGGAPAPIAWPQGPYLTTVSVQLLDLGEVRRTVWHDGQRWWLVGDGCATPGAEPFLVGEDVLTLRPSAGRLGWGPVYP